MTAAQPSAARAALRRLGWLAGDYAFAAWCQARGAVGPRDPSRYAGPPGRRCPDVVLVPGVLEPWAFLAPLAERLHRAGHAVHVVPGLGYHRQDLPEAARVVADVLVERDLRDVVLVGHSKGGLVGKLLLCDPDVGARVRGVVAIAAPFAGARRARLVPLHTIQVFRPDDPGIVALARADDADARIVSVFGSWDPHIPEGSALAGARNVRLATPGHFRVLADPRLPHVVLDAVAALAR
ncbi:putative lipase transmembrane protein [Xylanimonas cellulosilytica DSM 15894]|uniref:Lipase transmembrane protein n=1 Tax=Xylanimonas cellulosilytica (strain DSM 15894 / JCM 12276 / CECT 5975 / KCTC 9989 / LMG 20990 / NBRC 107835 / XIL07) TaxID=446471 RepID=D1BSU6_XYLCX|nr:lipase [Xylanimonas cellulosilytica]ACZ30788.1 putative lipase transmembrane protein [Xylanimonas cellulosilytica DSM 15894]